METNNKLREALKDIGRLVEQIHFLYSDYPSEIHDIARKVNAALAEPVKNCEVGTPREQADRMRHFCLYDQGGCGACSRRKDMTFRECIIDWEQMPYEANEKGEVDDTNGRTVQQQGEV